MSNKKQPISDKLKIHLQYLIPQRFLTKLVYWICRCQHPRLKDLLIRKFIGIFNVDMTLAKQADPGAYASFNEFFTRELATDKRPIILNSKGVLCPVDGTISQIGDINGTTIIQAKGKSYTLDDLLIDNAFANTFSDGKFTTLYLSPRDYHRVHMPMAGELLRTIYVPGKLFSVDELTVRSVDKVFAKNDRLINIFNTPAGKIAIVMVGAMMVAGMETVWAGLARPDKDKGISDNQYTALNKVTLRQGQEMGRFNMGSTVIMLFQKDAIKWSSKLSAKNKVVMGQMIARVM